MIIEHKRLLLSTIVLLAGCATEPSNMYNWDNYQPMVYQYYQGNKTSPAEQIAALNESINTSHAGGKKVPPGLHAQLGMLYANTGNTDLAFQEFKKEKTLFPESAPFMDSLLRKNKGGNT